MRQRILPAALIALILPGCSQPPAQIAVDASSEVAEQPEGVSEPQREVQEPSAQSTDAKPDDADIAGHAAFVVDNLARTLSSFDAAIGYDDCVYQGDDSQRFYNSLPGVGTNRAPNYGTYGNEAQQEFLDAMRRGLGVMLDYCNAIRSYEQTIDPNIALEEAVLILDATREIWWDFPQLIDAPRVVIDEYCRAYSWSRAVQQPVYQSLLDNEERLIRRSLTRDADMARIFREQDLDPADLAKNVVSGRYGTAAEFTAQHC